jgi:phosphate/sulfate permease
MAYRIVWAWVLTIPAAAAVSALAWVIIALLGFAG